jgi:hypothetical protein
MQKLPFQNESMFSRKQAAEFLGICKTTLDRLNIPRTKLRRRVLYRQSVLEKWLNDHTQAQEGYHEKQ